MTMMLPIQKGSESHVQQFRRPEEVLEQLRERKEKQLVKQLVKKFLNQNKAKALLQVESIE